MGLALVWEGRRGRPSDPRSQGRRASVWFDELVRTAGALGNDDQHLRHLEARIALLQLGATLETVERLARAETAGSALEKRLRPDP